MKNEKLIRSWVNNELPEPAQLTVRIATETLQQCGLPSDMISCGSQKGEIALGGGWYEHDLRGIVLAVNARTCGL